MSVEYFNTAMLKSIYKLLLSLSLGLTSTVFAQKTEILDDFSIYELNGKVYISCTVTQGQTCNGINVWRSSDNSNFSLVGHVDGICGSSSAPMPYNFTDPTPIFNKWSYYKVELGGSGFSDVLSIELTDTRLFGYQVRPNPANEQVTIYFENKSFNQYKLTIFDLYGKVQTIILSTSNEFQFSTATLNSGNYFFSIENLKGTENPVQGKLMIQH